MEPLTLILLILKHSKYMDINFIYFRVLMLNIFITSVKET
jgi:hypothetical protein